MAEGKYKQAYIAFQQITDFDPENQTAKLGMVMASVRSQEKRNEELKQQKGAMELYSTEFEYGPYLDPTNPIKIDPDRYAVSRMRPGSTPFKSAAPKNAKEREIERALDERRLTLGLNNISLKDCIEEIKQYVGGLNILIDDKALQEAGIRQDLPITMPVNDMSLRSALTHLLKKANLKFVVQNEAILITTEAYVRGNPEVWTHNVADLVIPVPNKRSPYGDIIDARNEKTKNDQLRGGGYYPPTPYQVPGGLAGGQPIGAGPGGYQSSGYSGDQFKAPERMEELLIKLITSTIAPESWSDVGGKGTIQFFPIGNALVVGQQTPDIQEQIVALLAALRKLARPRSRHRNATGFRLRIVLRVHGREL